MGLLLAVEYENVLLYGALDSYEIREKNVSLYDGNSHHTKNTTFQPGDNFLWVTFRIKADFYGMKSGSE